MWKNFVENFASSAKRVLFKCPSYYLILKKYEISKKEQTVIKSHKV